jgi:hypothetical protein
VARTATDTGTSTAKKSYLNGVRLASYRPGESTALLAVDSDGSGATVETGDVIASPPSEAAPKGALFKIGKVSKTAKGIEVTTEPATLSDALGEVTVERTFAAKDIAMSVTPLAGGVTSVTKEPKLKAPARRTGTTTPEPTSASSSAPPPGPVTGPITGSASPDPSPARTQASVASPSPAGASAATSASPGATTSATAGATASPNASASAGSVFGLSRTADGGFMLALDVPLGGVSGIKATSSGGPKLAGWVGLTPKLVFSFATNKAEIGVGGSYSYGWQVHAALDNLADTGEQPISLPLAEVHLSQTFWIGPVPVVIGVDLTYFYRVTAAGDLSIDTEQSTTGQFAFGAAYDAKKGWGPLNRNEATTTGRTTPVVAGGGDLRATVGADLSVLLYDAAGVTGRMAPYVRGVVDAGYTPPRWGVYAGLDITASLSIRLKIFGITILKADQPLPPIHTEWKVAASTPEPAGTATTG